MQFTRFRKNNAALLIVSLLVVALSLPVQAQEIYKTIDAEGNVTYSSDPPKPGQKTEIILAIPEPDAVDVEDAVQRQKKIEEDLEKLEQKIREQAEKEHEAKDSETTVIVTSNPLIVPVPRRFRHRRPVGRPPTATPFHLN